MESDLLMLIHDLAEQSKAVSLCIDSLGQLANTVNKVGSIIGDNPARNVREFPHSWEENQLRLFQLASQAFISCLLRASESISTVWGITHATPLLSAASVDESVRLRLEASMSSIGEGLHRQREYEENILQEEIVERETLPPAGRQHSREHMGKMTTAKRISSLEKQIARMHRTIARMGKRLEKYALTQRHWDEQPRASEMPDPEQTSPDTPLNEIYINSTKYGDKKKKNLRRWSRHTIRLMYVIYATSPKAYRLLGYLMAVPAVSTLYETYGPKLKNIESLLQNREAIPQIVENWRDKINRRGDEPTLPSDQIVDAVLGIDAASFSPTVLHDSELVRYCYLFLVMPLNPSFPDFTVHLFPYQSPSLGKELGPAMCLEIARLLKEQGVRILTFATDGDRGNVEAQRDLFESYKGRLHLDIDALSHAIFANRDIPWWIADTLHALKCQRTRLEKRLFLAPSIYVDARGMNETLNLNIALTNFQGLAKMSDVLAVEVFTMDNLRNLIENEKLVEAYYMLPFVCWYTAIALEALSWDTRLSLLRITWSVFTHWYDQWQSLPPGFLACRKFFVELIDLPRYMNTILFLYHITSRREPVAYNRLGTHSVENMFGLIWVTSHFQHTWPRFLGSSTRAVVVDDILKASKIKTHVRRVFSIGGVKILDNPRNLLSLYFPEGGPDALIQCLWRMITSGFITIDASVVASDELALDTWKKIFSQFAKWKEEGKFMVTNLSGPLAGIMIMARLIKFCGKKKEKSSQPKAFIWKPEAKRLARQLRINHTDDEIAQEVGCSVEDVLRLRKEDEWKRNAEIAPGQAGH
jgi:hypothetical protein